MMIAHARTCRRMRRLVKHNDHLEFELDSGRIVIMHTRTMKISAVEKQSLLLAHIVGEALVREGGSVLNLCTTTLSPVSPTLILELSRGLSRIDVLVQSQNFSSSDVLAKWFVRSFATLDSWWIARQVMTKQLAALSLLTVIDPGLRGMPYEVLIGSGPEVCEIASRRVRLF